jgi:hypothetical protein
MRGAITFVEWLVIVRNAEVAMGESCITVTVSIM